VKKRKPKGTNGVKGSRRPASKRGPSRDVAVPTGQSPSSSTGDAIGDCAKGDLGLLANLGAGETPPKRRRSYFAEGRFATVMGPPPRSEMNEIALQPAIFSTVLQKILGDDAVELMIHAKELAYLSRVFVRPPNGQVLPRTINSPKGLLHNGVAEAWFGVAWAIVAYLGRIFIVEEARQRTEITSKRLDDLVKQASILDLARKELNGRDGRISRHAFELARLIKKTSARFMADFNRQKPEAVLLDMLILAFGVPGSPTVLFQDKIPPRAWIVKWVGSLLKILPGYPVRDYAKLAFNIGNRRDLLVQERAKKGTRQATGFPGGFYVWMMTLPRFIANENRAPLSA
jgi:hypothetical protein